MHRKKNHKEPADPGAQVILLVCSQVSKTVQVYGSKWVTSQLPMGPYTMRVFCSRNWLPTDCIYDLLHGNKLNKNYRNRKSEQRTFDKAGTTQKAETKASALS